MLYHYYHDNICKHNSTVESSIAFTVRSTCTFRFTSSEHLLTSYWFQQCTPFHHLSKEWFFFFREWVSHRSTKGDKWSMHSLTSRRLVAEGNTEYCRTTHRCKYLYMYQPHLSHDMWFPTICHFDKCRLIQTCAEYLETQNYVQSVA